MNYTEKYHLPQWEESDRIMRTDFNQMCADIETGLDANAQAAQTAQTAADTAKSTADTALTHKNYVIGTYIGTGHYQIIALGFKPSAVLISTHSLGQCSLHATESSNVTLLDEGFQIPPQNTSETPSTNAYNYRYFYIAFR